MSLEIIEKIEKIYSKTVTLVSEGDLKFCEYISDKNKIFIKKMMEKNSFTGKKGDKLEVSFLEGGFFNNNTVFRNRKERKFKQRYYERCNI